MWPFYPLFLIPIALFVTAFLYETWLSFARLAHSDSGKASYVAATWEVTHTLLVFGVVVLVMTFTESLTDLAHALFWPTFVAAVFLSLRAATYIYIFYVRHNTRWTNVVDWCFAALHIGAALFLIITVLQALVFIWTKHPIANTEFFPSFIPGLILVIAVCAVPLFTIYRSK